MKHSGDVDGSAAEAIMEVELSADELQALPSTRDVLVAASASEPCTVVSAPTAPNKSPPEHNWLSSIRQLSATQVLGSVAVAVIASIAVRAQYQEAASQEMAPTLAWSGIPPRPTTVETDEPSPVATSTATLLPTLFENPFDKTEVFQFPPGTSREEARVIVADLLMKRARERLAR